MTGTTRDSYQQSANEIIAKQQAQLDKATQLWNLMQGNSTTIEADNNGNNH